MNALAFVIWAIGWPIAFFLVNLEYTKNSYACSINTSTIFIAAFVWCVVGTLLYLKA